MLTSIKQRLDREDEGFTLIELMVVLLIIAILLAIAIPTFLGARNTANARSTQENLRNALTAEQTTWTNTQNFDDNTTNMQAIEPSLSWTNSSIGSPGGNSVLVSTDGTKQVLELQAYAKDGKCYAIIQDNGAAGTQTGYSVTTSATGCDTVTPSAPTIAKGSAVDGGGFYQSW